MGYRDFRQLPWYSRAWRYIKAWTPVVLTLAVILGVLGLFLFHQYSIWSGCLAKYEYFECAAMLNGNGRILVSPESTNGR